MHGEAPRAGAVRSQPRLSATLEAIAREGRDAFYKGEIAETIDRYFKRIGGWMTRADMAAHLHDSVLQTLALIQKNSGDAAQVAGVDPTQLLLDVDPRAVERFVSDAIGPDADASARMRAASPRPAASAPCPSQPVCMAEMSCGSVHSPTRTDSSAASWCSSEPSKVVATAWNT